MTTNTAGTGNTKTNSSGLTSTGSQWTDKEQTPGAPEVGAALTSTVSGNVDVIASFEPGPDGKATVEIVVRATQDGAAPTMSSMFTPGRARALAAKLIEFADSADEVNGPSTAYQVDLDEWVPGEDVDDDALVVEELETARENRDYDFNGYQADLDDWVAGDDTDEDENVSNELWSHRVLACEPVDLGTWFPGADADADKRLGDEYAALRLNAGLGRDYVRAEHVWLDPQYGIRALRKQRRRNRNG
jgi:hypothetical protein